MDIIGGYGAFGNSPSFVSKTFTMDSTHSNFLYYLVIIIKVLT